MFVGPKCDIERKIEQLILKLSKVKPISARPAYSGSGYRSGLRVAFGRAEQEQQSGPILPGRWTAESGCPHMDSSNAKRPPLLENGPK